MSDKNFHYYSPYSRWPLAGVCLGVLLLLSAMLLWPQTSEPKLKNSNELLTTWDLLSTQFQKDLKEQSSDLQEALTETVALKASSLRLIDLYGRLFEGNRRLKKYADEVGKRLQENNEDLAKAYDEIDELKLKQKDKDVTIWKLRAACIGLGAAVLLFAVYTLAKAWVGIKMAFFKLFRFR